MKKKKKNQRQQKNDLLFWMVIKVFLSLINDRLIYFLIYYSLVAFLLILNLIKAFFRTNEQGRHTRRH